MQPLGPARRSRKALPLRDKGSTCRNQQHYRVPGIHGGLGCVPSGQGDSCLSPTVTVRQVGLCRTLCQQETPRSTKSLLENGLNRDPSHSAGGAQRPRAARTRASVFCRETDVARAKAF